jgi:hypothetical protein
VRILALFAVVACAGCNFQKIHRDLSRIPWYPSDPELITWAAQARTTVCGTATPTPEQQREICRLVRAQMEQAQKDWDILMTDRNIRSAELAGRQLLYRRMTEGY